MAAAAASSSLSLSSSSTTISSSSSLRLPLNSLARISGSSTTTGVVTYRSRRRRRRSGISTIAAALDSFVLDLAEKLEESATSNSKSNAKTLNTLREKCAQELLQRPWPTSKDERYRFTDLRFLRNAQIRVAETPSEFTASDALDNKEDEDFGDCYTLSFIDGVPFVNGSGLRLPAGAVAGTLGSLPPEVDFPEEDVLSFRGDVFSALNGIGVSDVAAVFIPRNMRLEKPLRIVYYSRQGCPGPDAFCVASPRLAVVVDEGAEVEILEEFKGAQDGNYWTNSVLQICLRDGAKISHSFVQMQSPNSVHIKWTFVQQGKASSYQLVETSCGGKLNRHNLEIEQAGPETLTEVSTFHLAGKDETQDLHSKLILNHPRGYGRQLHKCIVTDSTGHAIFDGNIKVNRFAQHTDAGQLTRCLLLAPRATVNVKPNLQIVADDVKCSHGAAISDLEEDQLFYFRARGVDAQTARNALVFSFGADVMGRIPDKHLRGKIENNINQLLVADKS